MSSTNRRSDEEAFEQGFHGIPDPQKRAGMSPEKLAIELSKLENGSPPYILLEHELNLRLAKEQAKATLSAGWLGAGATLIAVLLSAGISAGLGYLAGASQQVKQPEEKNACPREQQPTGNAAQPDSSPADRIKKTSPVPSVVPLSKNNDKNAAQTSRTNP